MTCEATTQSQGEVVRCKKEDAAHVDNVADRNHWGVTAAGMDVVWDSVVLKPPAKEEG